MKSGARALLLGIVLAAVTVCVSLAQESVSLIGLSAERTDAAVSIELHTTGPADFRVERFTMGDYVSVWSNLLTMSDGVDEIPLELDRPELADLVTGASLANESHHASIRFYLGPQADRSKVFLVEDGDIATLTIRALEGSEELGLTDTSMPDAAVPTGGDPLLSYVPEDLRSSNAGESVSDTSELEDSGETKWEFKPFVPTWTNEPVNPPAAQESEISAGSFYLPRESESQSSSNSAGLPIIGSPSSDAEVNYQYVPSGAQEQGPGGAGDDNGYEGTAPSLEDMMQAASETAAQMLGQPSGQSGQAAAQAAGPGLISTPGDTFRGSFQSEARVSAGTSMAAATGKHLLSGIQIDLFEIVGTPLDQAITLLIAPTDFNVIVDSSVGTNIVSLSFKDRRTDLKDAMDLLTRTYGLDYSVQANTVVVAAHDKINGQLVEFDTRLFVLSYADPLSVKEMLVTTNLLSESQIEIYYGEQEYPEVNDSTELAETTGRTNQESELMQSNLSSTPRNAVLVKAVPEQMDKIAEIIARIDRKPKIIELEVRVCEVTERGRQDLGLTVNEDFIGNVATTESWVEQPNENTAFEAFSIGSFYRSPLDFQVTLNHLVETGDASLLAQPKLNTVEGKQAIYFAGESIPYVSERRIDPQTGQETLTVEFIDIGVTLNFKPRLDQEGKLTIDVNPIVSSLIEMLEVTDGVFAPRSQNRQLRTTVRVADGEPFAMAGLISDRETETISKIPLLADLPMVGKLFRNRRTDTDRTEIIVIVVPHVTE